MPGTRIPTLAEVFALVRRSGDRHVRLNIETKIDPAHPQESPDPQHFVAAVLDLLRREQFSDRVMIQSFDWRTLLLVQKQAPTIPTVYLTQLAEPDANIYPDKPSRWTAGFDPQDHGGSVPRTVKAAGGAIWSPDYHDVDARSIAEAHQLGLPVVVWTVNRPEDMARLIDLGVDGIISDRPDLLRAEAAKKGIPCRRRHPSRLERLPYSPIQAARSAVVTGTRAARSAGSSPPTRPIASAQAMPISASRGVTSSRKLKPKGLTAMP